MWNKRKMRTKYHSECAVRIGANVLKSYINFCDPKRGNQSKPIGSIIIQSLLSMIYDQVQCRVPSTFCFFYFFYALWVREGPMAVLKGWLQNKSSLNIAVRVCLPEFKSKVLCQCGTCDSNYWYLKYWISAPWKLWVCATILTFWTQRAGHALNIKPTLVSGTILGAETILSLAS